MAKKSFRQQLDSLLGRKRQGISVKWTPTHRGVIDTSHRDIRKALGRGLKDDVHGYTFWDVQTDNFDSDFAPEGECIQISNRDFRTDGMIYEPQRDKKLDGRDEWFAIGSSPRAIRALADEVEGSCFSIEALEDKAAKGKLDKKQAGMRAKAEEAFKKKVERLGLTARVSHLRGRSMSVKGESGMTRRGLPMLDAVFAAAWETNLFRFYHAAKWSSEDGEVKVSFKEGRIIPSARWRLEKTGFAEAMEEGSSLSKRKGMEYPDIKIREPLHYQ